jgi:hypothetical protein
MVTQLCVYIHRNVEIVVFGVRLVMIIKSSVFGI